MRIMILAAIAALAFSTSATAAPNCKTGVPCGNTCIAKGKVCHQPKPPVCDKGKPCGNTCIAKDKVCHVSAALAAGGGNENPTESITSGHAAGKRQH